MTDMAFPPLQVGLMPKVRFAGAADAAGLIDLSDEALELLVPTATPAGFLEALVGADLMTDAIKLLGVSLPRREAVWWACLRARRGVSSLLGVAPAKVKPAEIAAIEAAEAWVLHPSEEKRRVTYGHAEGLGFKTAGAFAALAAFWSSGSIAPPSSAVVVPPSDELTGKAAAACVLLASAVVPAKTALRHRGALECAIDIASGGSGRRRPPEARAAGA